MSDVPRLLAAFDAGALVRPDPRSPCLVDLVHAVAAVTGATGPPESPAAAEMAAALGERDHLVLVLADGLGASMLGRLPPNAWLRTHLRRTLQTTFPSTTAVALTTLATGRWPADHAAVGWWTYLPTLGETSVLLPYQRLSDEKPLEEIGVSPADAFPVPAVTSQMRRDAAAVLPAAIAGSTYSRYITGGAPRLPYRTNREAVEAIARRIEQSEAPTFTYWYTSRIDTEAHDTGAASPDTVAAISALDTALEALAARLAGSARIAVTSDHGHLDVPPGGHRPIDPGDPFLAYLARPPSGDVRVLYFHLRPDSAPEDDDAARGAAFAAHFRERFGDGWLLLTTDEVESLRLLGPGPISPETRRRIGDFTAIALGGEVMRYTGVPSADRFLRQRGQHSGLSREEMLIPLVIA